MSRIAMAIQDISLAHHGQPRKSYKVEVPFIAHCFQVFNTVLDWGVQDEDTLCSCLLHDIIEDTKYRRDWLAQRYGDVVEAIVLEATQETFEDKYKYMTRLCKCGKIQTLVLKLADVSCNTMNYLVTNPKWAPGFLEKRKQIFRAYFERGDEIKEMFGLWVHANIGEHIVRVWKKTHPNADCDWTDQLRKLVQYADIENGVGVST